ncbi:hypothetical protein BC937DRAFT_95164 [Endogone sp. FLAS-F59071]|nr:hypothetical protein BC937DRAFT_95164 [Endogone sp. FLAS-F59071]|eukprot:RUS20463.1 hypothetical protein BC937DRAFT_95164 [Endogone sp. FLAS-F59071]
MAATAQDTKALVDVSTKGADSFVELFYKLYDNQRELLSRFYRDSSAILWNGNAYSGVAPFAEFCKKLPTTSHEIHTFDCHPLLATMNSQGSTSILVNVNGTVKYGDEQQSRQFNQTFILAPDIEKVGNYYVGGDTFSHPSST